MVAKVVDGWPPTVPYGKAPSKYSWDDAITVTRFIDSRAPLLISKPLRDAVNSRAKKRKAPAADGGGEGDD